MPRKFRGEKGDEVRKRIERWKASVDMVQSTTAAETASAQPST